MKNKILIVLITSLCFAACTTTTKEKSYSGSYLGLETPKDSAIVFAPDFLNTGMFTRDLSMSPDGKEIYFGAIVGNYVMNSIFVTKEINGKWTKPELMPFMENFDYMNMEPHISPDGKRFFFLSKRNDEQFKSIGGQDLWVMDRIGDTWGKPYNLGEPINSEQDEFFPSLTKDGHMYFTRSTTPQDSKIWRSKFIDGKYQEPEVLPEQVNSGTAMYNAFVDPEERFIIVPTVGRKDSKGRCDYYISFRNEDDTWRGPYNMGDKINTTNGWEYSPYISPDGKYLFFMSFRPHEIDKSKYRTFEDLNELHHSPGVCFPCTYWISTDFIYEMIEESKAK